MSASGPSQALGAAGSRDSERREGQPLSQRAFTLVLVLVVLTTISIEVAVVMAILAPDPDTLWFEIGKLVAQAGILTGFGAFITLLVHEFQQDQELSRKRIETERQRLSSRHDWLRDFTMQVSGAYTELKQARRRLQWALRNDESGDEVLSAAVYEKQLKRISAVEATFEQLQTLADSYFADGEYAKSVVSDLGAITEHLSRLISERKRWPRGLSGPQASVPLNEIAEMRAFTAQSEQAAFHRTGGFAEIKAAYARMQTCLMSEMRASGGGA